MQILADVLGSIEATRLPTPTQIERLMCLRGEVKLKNLFNKQRSDSDVHWDRVAAGNGRAQAGQNLQSKWDGWACRMNRGRVLSIMDQILHCTLQNKRGRWSSNAPVPNQNLRDHHQQDKTPHPFKKFILCTHTLSTSPLNDNQHVDSKSRVAVLFIIADGFIYCYLLRKDDHRHW